MEQLLKEIDEVLDANKSDMLIAIAFLHGMRAALALGLNKGEETNENL